MATWLDSIMSPLNAAGEGLQKLIETRDLVKFGDTFREMHGQIITAQRGAIAANVREAALLDQIRTLEEKVRNFETWNTEKDRYEMKALRSGVYAYMLKPAERGVEAPHWVCITCYNNRKYPLCNGPHIPLKTIGNMFVATLPVRRKLPLVGNLIGCKMARKPERKPDDPAQYKRFIEAARKAEADETKEAADRAFKKVVIKPPKPHRPSR
jgi:hypothetical protein